MITIFVETKGMSRQLRRDNFRFRRMDVGKQNRVSERAIRQVESGKVAFGKNQRSGRNKGGCPVKNRSHDKSNNP